MFCACLHRFDWCLYHTAYTTLSFLLRLSASKFDAACNFVNLWMNPFLLFLDLCRLLLPLVGTRLRPVLQLSMLFSTIISRVLEDSPGRTSRDNHHGATGFELEQPRYTRRLNARASQKGRRSRTCPDSNGNVTQRGLLICFQRQNHVHRSASHV